MTTLPNALRVKPNMVEPSKDISVIVPLVILSVIVVLANCSVFALVCFKKTLRTYTNWLVLSLAVADILTGGVLLPFIVIKSTSVVTDYLITIILGIVTTTAAPAVNRFRCYNQCFRLIFWLFCN